MASRFLLNIILLACLQQVVVAGGFSQLRLNTSEVVRAHGFKAKDHFYTTSEGYILNLVEVLNPEISGGYSPKRDPVLFIHGVTTNGLCWIVNAKKSHPTNYANLNAYELGQEGLNRLLLNDPTSSSLPLILSSFGHRVFIMNRRGTYQSQGYQFANKKPDKNPFKRIGKAFFGGLLGGKKESRKKLRFRDLNLGKQDPYHTQNKLGRLKNQINPNYWNFSLDEQAEHDTPELIDYILSLTNTEEPKRVSLVGHSAGGALILMSQIIYPELASKISKQILLAPAFYSTGWRFALELGPFLGFLRTVIGPVPPSYLNALWHRVEGIVCVINRFVCENVFNMIMGASKQNNIVSIHVSV